MKKENKDHYSKSFFADQMDQSLQSARIIVPYILDLVHPKSVVDVGCGVGTWLHVFEELGIKDVVGIDGDYVDRRQLKIDPAKFVAHDLTRQINLERTFDLAISVEVAEHLPKNVAEAFINHLTSLAPVVVFSAAIPHQGGTNHINEQWQSYWAAIFNKYGYQASPTLRERIWSNKNVQVWYRQNIIIYVKKEITKTVRMHYTKSDAISSLDVVHPDRYLRYFKPARALLNAFGVLISAIVSVFRR